MKILVIQNRMGIGDTVIFLPFIEAISKKYNCPINLLVKKTSKAEEFLKETKYIDKIIILERNKHIKNYSHNGVAGGLRLAKELKKHKFDVIFIFNASLRYRIIAKLSGSKKIYQFSLFKKKKLNFIEATNNLIFKKLKIKIDNLEPKINIDKERILDAKKKYNFLQSDVNILLGIGGSGPTKRIPPEIFLEFMKRVSRIKKCRFFLATGKKDDEQLILKKIMNSEFHKNCVALDNLSIFDCLPIISLCNIAVCNDSSFSHLSSALNIKTITLMADTPIMYGNYNSNMYPIIPDDEMSVTHGTNGKERINPQKIFNKFLSIIN
tara:strand:- start:296 stop:1264 length:969 start_codon:yes stop_codon:yes gene_type:complete